MKWVNQLYIHEGKDFWTSTPPGDCNWYWKTLHKLKLKISDWYIDGKYSLTGNDKYSIAKGYEKLSGIEQKWEIAELLWNKFVVPKHCFISWLIFRKRVLTKDRLQGMGIKIEDKNCSLCNGSILETIEYLFVTCLWFAGIWKDIQKWLGIILSNG